MDLQVLQLSKIDLPFHPHLFTVDRLESFAYKDTDNNLRAGGNKGGFFSLPR